MAVKTKAHQRYKNKAGEIVPGVTTITGLKAKPQLVIWANRLGLKGIDSSKYRDEKADIGTLAHAMILAHLKGEQADTSDYSANQITEAENCFLSYLAWAKGKDIKPNLVEQSLISEAYQFGGCLDFYGTINGELVLVDYKTGGIYDEAKIQTCAYRQLLIENEHPAPDKIIILGIPRTEDEKFQEVTFTKFDVGWKYFKNLRENYNLDKLLK
jgi:hypothetical protein